MNFKINLLLLFLISPSFGLAQIEFTPKKSSLQIEQEHSLLSSFSYPSPNPRIVDSLLHTDFSKFDRLMEIAFALKHDSLYDSRLYELINELGTTSSEKKLQSIAQELSSYGTEALIALEKTSTSSISFLFWRHVVRVLVLGYEINDFFLKPAEDFVISHRQPNETTLKRYFKLYGTFHSERIYLQNRLREFISSASYAKHKDYYHKLAIDTYQKGTIHQDFKSAIIAPIIRQESFNKHEEYLNDYLLLIDKIEVEEVIDLTDFIIAGNSNRHYPQLFLDLLSCKNEKIVEQVIGLSYNCGQAKICDLVRERLIVIFNEGSKALKFKAAYVLMASYGHSEAYNYLISLVDTKINTNDETTYAAIFWLGDLRYYGKKMPSSLHAALKNHLNSGIPRIKQTTIETYLTYSSRNVIEAMIPMMDYEVAVIAKRIQEKVLSFEDKAFTIKKLRQYLATGKGAKVHLEILNKLK